MSDNDLQLHKLPPQNLDAEQGILGAILIDQNALSLVQDIIEPRDFYKTAHRTIYEAMHRLSDLQENIDLITMPEELRGKGDLESVGGASYLALLVSLVPTSANVKSHARIVREKAIMRRTVHAANEIISRCYDETKKITAGDLIDFAEQSIFAVSRGMAGGELVPMRTCAGESFAVIEKRYENKGTITGVPTGFVDLDDRLAGLQPSDLVLIAARPSMGKTAFALNIAAHAGLDKKLAVAVFSLEMSRQQLTLRIMSSESRVDAHRIRTGYLQERDWSPLSHAAGRLAASRMHIDDTSAISVQEIRSRCRRMKADQGLDLIIVDYLQLMRGRGDEGNREQEISGISRSLKALAKELDIPVVALSQLNRALESRVKDRRPVLADLRESGALEQDADVILFLYREEAYNKCECPEDAACICNRRGTAEVIIGKQRNGPTGKIDLAFLKSITRFENAEKRF